MLKLTKSTFLSLFILFFFLSPYSLQAEPTAATTKHSLWEMDTKNGKVYLMGSIHFLRKQDYPLPPIMEEIYNKSNVIAFEADLNEANSTQVQQLALDAALYKNDETLSMRVTPEVFEQIQRTLKKLGQSPNMLNSYKPWFASVNLAVLDAQVAGYEPSLGIDNHFHKKATNDKKGLAFFEKASFQIKMLSDTNPFIKNDT